MVNRCRCRSSCVIPKPEWARDLTRHRHGTFSTVQVGHEISQSLHSLGMTLSAQWILLPTCHAAPPPSTSGGTLRSARSRLAAGGIMLYKGMTRTQWVRA